MAPTFESTNGRRASLETFRGRPVVVFYESQGRDKDNDVLKTWCARLVEQQVVDVEVLGIANLDGLGFVRRVVTPVVRAVAAAYGIELWMDYRGQLLERPWNLRKDASNVMLVDGDGAVRFARSGVLDQADIEDFVGTLRECLAEGHALDRVSLPKAA